MARSLFCSLTLVFFVSLLFSQSSLAKSFHSTTLDYHLEVPKTWVGSFSGNKASLRLTARRSSELTITFQAKRARDKLKGNAVMRQFKGQYASKKRAEPKVVVSIKPGRTTVGEYTGYHYGFRYRNFLDQVFDERTIWFNARRPNKSLLLFKVGIKGPAKALSAEQQNVAMILASFCMVGQKEDSQPSTPAPQPTQHATSTHVPTPKPTQTSSGGDFDGGRSRGGSSVSSGDDDDDDYEPGPSDFKFSQKRGTDYSHLYGKREAKNVSGLMKNAKRIDDPEKFRKARRTFLHRNRRRTADQKRRAAKYMAGVGGDDVTE